MRGADVGRVPVGRLLLEEFGMTAQINENHVLFCYLVDQQEIPTDMAFAVAGPVAGQLVIQVFLRKRFAHPEECHYLAQLMHVMPASAVVTLPGFLELRRAVGALGQRRPFFVCRLWGLLGHLDP